MSMSFPCVVCSIPCNKSHEDDRWVCESCVGRPEGEPEYAPKEIVTSALAQMACDPRLENADVRRIFLSAVHYLTADISAKTQAAVDEFMGRTRAEHEAKEDDYEVNEPDGPAVVMTTDADPPQPFTGKNTIERACCVAEGMLKSGRSKVTVEVQA